MSVRMLCFSVLVHEGARGTAHRGSVRIRSVSLVLSVAVQRCMREGGWTVMQFWDVYGYIRVDMGIRAVCRLSVHAVEYIWVSTGACL